MSDNPFALANIQEGGATAPANDNPFSLAAIERDQGQDLRNKLRGAVTINPDQAARAAHLAKQYPVPTDVLARNLQDVEMQAAVDAADKRLQTSPILAKAMRDGKSWLAPQAHDDVGPLADVEQFFRDTGGSVKAGVFNASKGAAGVFRAGFELVAPALDFLEPVTDVGGNPLRRLAEGFAMQAEAASGSAKAAAPKTTGVVSSGFQSGIQSLTQNTMMLPLAFLPGGQAAALGGMTAFTGGQSYQDAREKGLPMSQALPFAASQAAIEYATEKLPLGQLIGDVKAGTPFFQMLAKQIALEVPGEQVATILQDLNEWAVLNPEKPFSSYLEERPSAAAQTLVATIVGTGGNVAVVKSIESVVSRAVNNSRQIQDAERMSDGLQTALQAAAASKLRERNPDTFKQLVQAMADESGGDVASVFIDAQVLMQSGVNVAEVLPSAAEQMDAALATGGSVEVAIGDVLAAAPGTPLEQVFLQNARGTADGLSMAEAQQAFEQADRWTQEADRVMAEAQDQQAWQTDADAVKTTILDQLNTTGRFTPDVNEAYATLVRDFYSVMAGRQGVTPQEMYARYPLRVGAQAQTAGPQLDQALPAFGSVAGFDTWLAANTKNEPDQMERPSGPGDQGVGTITLDAGQTTTTYDGGMTGSQRVERSTADVSLLFRLDDGRLVYWDAPTGKVQQVQADDPRIAFNPGKETAPTPSADPVPTELAVTVDGDEYTLLFPDNPARMDDTAFNDELYSSGYGDNVQQAFRDARANSQQLNQRPLAIDTVRQQWDAEGLKHSIIENRGRITLSQVIVPENERGTGKGTAAMQALVAYADQTGQRIELTPSSDFGGNKKRLTEFYKRFGFVENKGRNKDFEVSEGMYRPAQALAQTPAAFDGPETGSMPIGDATTVDVDGKTRPALNSNGQPIAATLDGVRNFWRWFGDSKVVDAEGRPLVVYHGTDKKFTKVNLKKGAQGLFWFTSNREAIEAGEVGAQASGVIMELYAKLENPADWKQYDNLTLGEFKGRGLDGAILRESDGSFDAFIIDRPTQIKSATGNSGAFNGQDANILRQQARGTFSPSQLAIVLNENANLSTFLHESGHFFLEVMADLASQPDAPAQVREDMDKLLAWFGIKGDETVGGADSGVPLAQAAAQGYEGSDAGEAAEWLAAAAKGLDMSLEARMARAEAMGFDTGKTLYHSTLADTKEFAPFGKFMGFTGTSGISVTDSPEMASRYLDRYAEFGWVDGKPNQAFSKNVIPVFIRPGKILERNDPFPMPPDMRLGAPLPADYVPAHKRMGYDTLVRDDAISRKGPVKHSDAKNAIRGKEYVLTDPSQVRSIFAAFDPDNAASSNLLAQDGNLPADSTQPAGRTPLEVWRAMTLDQKRAHHERFAESFEQYLLEGKAPSTELQGLFRKFRSWMLNVYKSLTQFMRGRDLKLSDDVRQVFDRMLATDEQIRQAEETAGLLPDVDATADAIEKLQARSLRDLKWTVGARSKAIKVLQKQAAELRKGVESEVRAEVDAMPEFRAQAELKKLKKPTDMELATVADSFGYESSDAMLKAIADVGKKADVIEGLTDQRMLERHGDLIDQRAIEEAANEAVHNEARARSLATELRSQAEMLNPREDTGRTASNGRAITVNALTEAAKQFAQNVVARRRVADLRKTAAQHRAAEARAGKRWQEATAAGNTQDAVAAKRDQLLNNYTVKAALEAQAEVKKITEFFARVTKGSNEKLVERGRDPDVVNAARAVLAAYGVAPRLEKAATEYLDVVARTDPAMHAALQPSVQGALQSAKPVGDLTMEELRGLADEIRAMWHLAKRSRQMEIDGNMLDIEDAADELQARMQEIGVPDSMPGDTRAVTASEKRARWLQHAGSLLRRAEQWAEGMDGKFGGPFLRLVFQPVKLAADRYRADRVKYRKAYQALVDAVAPAITKGPIAAPELGYTFGEGPRGIGHTELLHAILHTGNESNKRKLLLGRGWGTENADGTLDTSKWDAFIQRMHDEGVLAKAHYDFAQGVWDLLEQTKPLAQKTHRDVFGRYFAEVTADEFDTPFGKYKGGYVPAQADPEIVQDADLRKLAEAENESMAFSFPTTNKGFTKGRVEYNRPLKLDLRSIGQHLDKVLLFSHMEPAVRDVNKLLSQKGVSYSLGRIDPTIYAGMLTPWLNRSARQIVETPILGDGGISRVASAARSRAGMALMFANVSNTLQQVTGFATAFAKIKADGLQSHMARATAQFIASPRAFARNVAAASPFMDNRMENEVSAINDAMDEILLDQSLYEKTQAWTLKHAYFLQTAMANTMEPIIWTAGYNGALQKGMSEADAVRYADGLVRQTQGSTLPEDVSRIETGPAYARVFTQFIGYFNMMANTNATALKQIAQEQGLRKGAGKALLVLTAGMLVPLWVAEAIAQAMRGGPEDEDDDGYLDDWLAAVFGMGTIKGSLAMVPFVGQLANAGINRMNSNPADDKVSLSPAVSLLESGVGVPKLVYQAMTDPDKINARNAVRDVASAISITTGLPAYAIARPLGYLAGVEQGRIDPTSEIDAARGMLTGSASPDSKN